MQLRSIFLPIVSSSLALAACGAVPDGEPAGTDGASSSSSADAESALIGQPSFRCPSSLNVNYQGRVTSVFNFGISARFDAKAQWMTCRADAFQVSAGLVEPYQWEYNPPAEIPNERGDTIAIVNGNGFTLRSWTCPKRAFTLTGTDWPNNNVTASARVAVTGGSLTNGKRYVHFTCEYYFPENMARVIRNRPSDIVLASNGAFYSRTQLSGSDRTNACRNICSTTCTANVQSGSSTEGITQCINSCTATCDR